MSWLEDNVLAGYAGLGEWSLNGSPFLFTLLTKVIDTTFWLVAIYPPDKPRMSLHPLRITSWLLPTPLAGLVPET